jgi:hypothetical protein
MISSIVSAILQGREWSWSVIGLGAMVLGIGLRMMLITDILRRLRVSNRKWYKRTHAYYEARSLFGWIAFLLFVIGSMLVWSFESFFVKYLALDRWIIILAGILVLSLFLQLRAYARAMIDAAQEQIVSDKDL